MKYAADVAGITGLSMIGYGCWLISKPMALIVVGSILFCLSGFAFWSRKGGE